MHLTQHTDYALRTLMYLALQEERKASVTEIADLFGISRNHLMKVAQDLRRLGYVETQRGRGGGLQLNREPTEIALGAVVRETESFQIVECFDEARNRCLLTPSCGLQMALSEATQAFLAKLDEYSLADLLADPGAMRKLVAIEP